MRKWENIGSDSVYIKLATGQIKLLLRVGAQTVKQTKQEHHKNKLKIT